MNMQENQKKAFDFASDLTKQLITLSTGIITISVAFSKDIIGKTDHSNRVIMLLSWVLFILSIMFGLLTMMALAGNLDPMPKKVKGEVGKIIPVEPQLTITTSNITGTSKLQVLLFFLAVCLIVVYGYNASSEPSMPTGKTNKNYPVVRKTILSTDTAIYIDTLYAPVDK